MMTYSSKVQKLHFRGGRSTTYNAKDPIGPPKGGVKYRVNIQTMLLFCG